MPGDNANLWEEMLDVCACYFPVDFEPDGTDNITREQLCTSLSQSLLAGLESKNKIAIAKHSPVILNMILEKLHSDSEFAINDRRG